MSPRPPPPPPASRVDVSAYTRQSRTYEPGDPDLRKKRVRPFRLDELERFPRRHRDVYRALNRILPEAAFEPGLLGQVRQVVQRYTEVELDLWLHSVRVLERTHLRALIPGATFIAVLGLPPLGEKVLVEIDMRFVYRAVDRLLGGHGVAVDIHRPLTEIEQGVFSYLLLKVLTLFQGQITHPEQVAVRLEDMRNDLKSTADILRHEDLWLCASWKMNFDLDVGYVRALLPVGLARAIAPERAPEGSALAERMRNTIRQRMGRLAGVTVEGAVEVGRIALSRPDLEALDPGDIILLDECHAQLRRGEIEGQAVMTIGLGRNAAVHGRLSASGGGDQRQLVFEVTHIERREVPSEHDPNDIHGQLADPEQVVAEYEDPRPWSGDEADDGATSADDLFDEDWGLDDENEGDDEEYGDYDEQAYGEQGYEEQGYEEQGYGEQGEEEIAVDDSDNLEQAEPLLGDIPMHVVVELGRVQLTADEVIRLRPGQLIELGRSPADPVDLVVSGRLLAKGELVEIEGALGVKILNLVKEGE